MEASARTTPVWPPRQELMGVRVSVTAYDELLEPILAAAAAGVPAIVDHMPTAGLVEFGGSPSLRRVLDRFDVVAPDGHPVRWALNWLRGTQLEDRVYGPELMLRLCQGAAERGIGIYLYGSVPAVLARLRTNLMRRFPELEIRGAESPPFRRLTSAEDRETVERINASGAGLVFVGLGCPKQEIFAYLHRERIRGVQLCVGAAFDFLAGTKPMAPDWMQERGFEWLFRLASEPGRLWRRYLVGNSIFLARLAREALRARLARGIESDPESRRAAQEGAA
jgi:exopolysaccharide biosynthesis WecB/TagA/CpsF family protein